MNDAERDAWLREALRHAPDADALPPSGVSESILLKARAAARGASAPARRSEPRTGATSAFARFWAWLARPPVAGAFASVMAATLVGLMWWDRPMDETLAPPPTATTSDRRAEAAPLASKSAPAAQDAPLPSAATPTPAAPAPTTSPAPAAPREPAVAREVAGGPAPAARAKTAPEQEMRDAKVAPTSPAPAAASTDAEPLAKERAAPEAAKREAPAPFPATESQRRERLAAKSLDAAKKDSDAEQHANVESRPPAAAANLPESDALRRADLATGGAAATGQVRAQPAAPAQKLQRQRAADDERDKSVAGFAAPAPTPFRSAPAPVETGGRAATPLVSVLAAIAADPGAWSRRTAGGDSFALEPGWRAWLGELDAAAAGRWRAVGAGSTSEVAADRGDRAAGATTLRLVAGGSVAAVVRVEGTIVQVELPGGAGRWQATLGGDAGERVRSSAQRLPR